VASITIHKMIDQQLL